MNYARFGFDLNFALYFAQLEIDKNEMTFGHGFTGCFTKIMTTSYRGRTYNRTSHLYRKEMMQACATLLDKLTQRAIKINVILSVIKTTPP